MQEYLRYFVEGLKILFRDPVCVCCFGFKAHAIPPLLENSSCAVHILSGATLMLQLVNFLPRGPIQLAVRLL